MTKDIAKLIERNRNTCIGEAATVQWPHRLFHDNIAALDALQAEVEQFRRLATDNEGKVLGGILADNERLRTLVEQALDDQMTGKWIRSSRAALKEPTT